ncbi:hypothetical protein THRCLA_09045 [Thraustotheca clavata]|uniref:Cyclin N-terminal domain-containing protein n=1 Tax=Thraustotheca clavata TaxID=74557 RepID=A0A1V9Z078_9STRA|nr:hypothetical protein THRCLA_09045 [Thraustotheca clavata]
MYSSAFYAIAEPKSDAHMLSGAMGNEMTKNTIDLDVEMIQNYRYRELDKDYAVHLYAQNAITASTLDWSSFHTARGRLVHRIFSIGSALGLKRETCHLACSYMTRILLSTWLAHGQILLPTYGKTTEHPNILMATTVLVIASKIEEVNPPSMQDILEAVQRESGESVPEHAKMKAKGKRNGRKKLPPTPSVYTTKEDVLAYEQTLLKQLKWKLYPATPVTWLMLAMEGMGLYKDPERSPPSPAVYNSPCYVGYEYYDYTSNSLRKEQEEQQQRLQRAKDRMVVFHLACNLLDVSTLDSYSINFLPSILGGAALFLFAPGHNLYALAHFLLVTPEQLWECIVWMQYYLPYVTQPVPLSVHPQFQSKLAKVPQEDRYAIQVLSTTTAFGTLVFYPMSNANQPVLMKSPPSPQFLEPALEPESENWMTHSPSMYLQQQQTSTYQTTNNQYQHLYEDQPVGEFPIIRDQYSYPQSTNWAWTNSPL